MLSEADKKRIIAQETAAFLSDGLGTLDLSGSPDLMPLVEDKFAASDSKGFNNVVQSQANQLKALAENPDQDTIARLAQETGDPDLAQHILDEREGAVAENFVAAHPSYYRSDWNYDRLRSYLDDKHQEFNAENLDAAFKFLTRSGQLEVKPGQARNLDESELLSVINLAKNNQIEQAVTEYLTFTFPDAGDTWDDENLFLSDPRTVAARNAACKFVWFHSRPQVQDTVEFRQFEKTFLKNKVVHTIADYDAAYAAFEKYDRQIRREDLLRDSQPVGPARADLEEMSDEQINSLTHKTLNARAKQMIAARGRAIA
jgi:hypothetical protein